MLDIGRLSSGAADYYLGEVATSAEDYYTGHGESAGRWIGSLAADLGLEGTVDPTHFRAVLDGRHPFSDEQLARSRSGRRPVSATGGQPTLFDDDVLDLAQVAVRLKMGVRRVRQLVWAGERPGTAPDRFLRATRRPPEGRRGRPGWVVPRVEVERLEAARSAQRARPGYDLTLRPPKSVSVLWALAPEAVRAEIRQAHADAVDQVVAYMETHAVRARQSDRHRTPVDTDGLICAAFDHRTSRAGDPLLHTHVVTANLTRTVTGRWQALDARPLYDHARPAGTLYQAHLRHHLTRRLGVQWGPVTKGWAEIAGIPQPVIRAFSKRRDEIEEMVAESGYTSARAFQTATLATRQAKEHGIDPETLLQRWRDEAEALGFGPNMVAACLGRPDAAPQPIDEAGLFDDLAGADGLTRQASTFQRKEVVEAVAERVADGADAAKVEQLIDSFLASGAATPLAGGRDRIMRRTGNLERSPDLTTWSTPELLAKEADLLTWATTDAGNDVTDGVAPDVVDGVLAAHPNLSGEQQAMVRTLADPANGPIVTVAGRPGAGKTTATAVYVRALTTDRRPVVGCALAATAAGELEAACRLEARTGRAASTIARLLLELDRAPLAPGATVIVDEASMVGTRDLHRLAVHAGRAGGRLVLIGDPDQHGSVEVGGLFRHLTTGDGTLPRAALTANNRQTDPGDRDAVDQFRQGAVEAALARYEQAGRVIRRPDAASLQSAMVDDWWAHATTGSRDPMITGTNHVRRQLNQAARRRMVDAGRITGPTLTVGDLPLAAGDRIVTRKNHRALTSAHGWVKNGSVGTVTAVDHDRRTVTVAFDREGTITLPPTYLDAGRIDHAYARTTYGVQGATLNRAFIHLDDRTDFEQAYVALTRGRTETRIYVVDGSITTDADAGHMAHERAATGLDTVAQAMQHRRAGTLAHDHDPTAGTTLTYSDWDLRRLRSERGRLQQILDAGPPDVTEALRSTRQEHDRATTRLRTRSGEPNDPTTRNLRRTLVNLDRRLNELTTTHQARIQFLNDHRHDVDELTVVRHAEAAREAVVATQATTNPDPRVIEVLGVRPELPVRRKTWADAVALVAMHHERHGACPAAIGNPAEKLLGTRPVGLGARLSYDRTAEAIVSALTHPERDAVPQPAVDAAASLFD